jgi:hypothetical protein
MVLEMTPSAVDTSNAFFLLRGHCFRTIRSDIYLSAHCDRAVVWKGQWRDANGEVWTVEACELHKPQRDDREISSN